MRKFTKGLLLTFVATAMSLGAYAQDKEVSASVETGYYRVINAGYVKPDANGKSAGVVEVLSPYTAQPMITRANAVVKPGTIMYIETGAPEGKTIEEGGYIDVNPNDMEVTSLRSQGIDASKAVYGKMVQKLQVDFVKALKDLNKDNNWGLSDAEQAEILEKMFEFMKMYLEPTESPSDEFATAYYLKSTTPNTKPLADVLIEKEIVTDVQDEAKFTQELWKKFMDSVIGSYTASGDVQSAAEYEYFDSRIHMGHTYYLIGGRVDVDFNVGPSSQKHNPGAVENAYISFANKNTVDYPGTGYTPEIEVAGDYAKWYLEPVTSDINGTSYFAVQNGIQGNEEIIDEETEEKGIRYYTTLFTDFPMQIVQNGENTVRVWGIKTVPQISDKFGSAKPNPGDNVAFVTATEYTDIVPALTPVVIECTKTASKYNLLLPTGKPINQRVEYTTLTGIFFPADFDGSGKADNADVFKFYNYTPRGDFEFVSRKVVRVFNRGKNTLNPLGFYKFAGSTIAANKAFMILDESMAYANIAIVDNNTYLTGIEEVAVENPASDAIYDIQGRRVSNPTKGLYIVNGKKVIK